MSAVVATVKKSYVVTGIPQADVLEEKLREGSKHVLLLPHAASSRRLVQAVY